MSAIIPTEVLPSLRDLHNDALILFGLIKAMDALEGEIRNGGDALFACIECALPRARKLTDDLERAM